MGFKREWIAENQIKKEHLDLSIRQVYCWLYSKDSKIAIGTKDEKNWQLPGGHPITGESIQETCIREVKEETGVNIQKFKDQIRFFGYYVIEELNDAGETKDKFLQVRVLLKLGNKSEAYTLHPTESDDDMDKIIESRWVETRKLYEYIPWIGRSEELKRFREICESSTECGQR